MRVLHIIARVNVGGTARWLETLTAEQEAAGHQVVVAAGRVHGHEVEDPGAEGLPLVRVDRLGRAVSPLDDLVVTRELRALIGDLRPDVVNTHTAKAGIVGRIATLSLGRQRPALVHTAHGHLLQGYYSGPKLRAIAHAERALAAKTDVVLAVGSRVRQELVAAGIVENSRVIAVMPGVGDYVREARGAARDGLGVSDAGEGRPTAGWLGRLTRIKRPDRLAGAALSLPDVNFLVGGDGDLGARLRERAPANLRSLGWVEPSTFWSACDLAVLTSDNEGVPISLIEAALAGLPAVTTDAGSASDVVLDGVTGLVVPRSADAVAIGIRELTADPVAMAAMGEAARARALQEFSPARMLAEHTAAYERAFERR